MDLQKYHILCHFQQYSDDILQRRGELAGFHVSGSMFFIEKGSIRDILGIREVDALISLVTQNGTGYYLLLVGAIALVAFSIVGLIVKKVL